MLNNILAGLHILAFSLNFSEKKQNTELVSDELLKKIQLLRGKWVILMQSIQIDAQLAIECFEDIIKRYSEKGRYYHDLVHLYDSFSLMEVFEDKLDNRLAVYLAIFYHDIIYKPHRKDNELKSAEYAVEKLTQLGFEQAIIDRTYQLILATQTHEVPQPCPSKDFYYVLDTDLFIFGNPKPKYEAYRAAIRKEYRLIPNFLYRKGRRKILEQLSQRKPFFLTEEMQMDCEVQAQENLAYELSLL